MPHHPDDATQLALTLQQIGFRLATLETTLQELENTIGTIQNKVDALRIATDRWKGGIAVILGLGGIITWLISVGSNLGKMFK